MLQLFNLGTFIPRIITLQMLTTSLIPLNPSWQDFSVKNLSKAELKNTFKINYIAIVS